MGGGGKINSLNAQETITIGSGDVDKPSNNIPSNFYHNYSFTQQIYTSEQLGFGKGVISDIAFFRTDYNADRTRNYDVYMVNTSKTSFTEGDWVTVTEEDKVFSGDITFKAQLWNVIDIEDFEYKGENILICIDDNTGGYPGNTPFKENTTSGNTTLYYYSDNDNPSPNSLPSQEDSKLMKSNNQIMVTYTPSVTVRPSSIDFGVRASGAWAEPKTIQIDVLQNTTITNIESTNPFFVIPNNIDYSDCTSLEITTGMGDAGEKTGNLVITYNGGSVKVPMTATAYIPTDGDVVEEAIEVTFIDNAFSHPAKGMHDDYILPGETVDGNLNDAVYKFTLEEDALITATVEGRNPIVAIYDEDFGGEDGPSSDNNTGGQSGPTAPTTFFYDFNDGDLSDFTLIEKDTETAGKFNHENNWEIALADGIDNSKCLISYSYRYSPPINNANNIIMTNDMYNISESSQLSFDAANQSPRDPDYLKVEVSADGENFIYLTTVTPGMGSWLKVNVDLGVLLTEKGLQYGEYHIALHHDEHFHMYIKVDNLKLTDGSAKSRAGEPQIDGVLYPAGTYYLVAAAAESDFTLNLSTLPAPKQFAYTSPEDGATEQDNPVLTWESAEYASSYDVYLGTTSNTLTKVATDITATSFQTTGLSKNTKYYWKVVAKNTVGNTEGEVYSFITPLDIPQNVRASSNEIYPDNNGNNNVTIEWDAITGVEGYNVYVKFNGEGNAIKHNGNKLVTATSYDLLKMDYSKNGHVVYVKAVYEIEGEPYESNMSATQTIKVTDYTTLSVTVEDANGDQIDGAKIVLQGKDEFGKDINYNNLENGTYENGTYTLEVLPGTYTATITKLDYNDVVVEVTLSYTESNTLDVVMQSKPSAPFTVNAEEGSASWEANYSSYNVYRRDGEGNVTSLATGVTAKQYQDTDWESLANGEYEYGVSAMMDADESRINWSYPVEKGGIAFISEGDWNTAANWNTNTVPNTEDKVTIKGNATITEGVITVGSIRIASGATLTVKSGVVLNVTNGIINTNAAALVMEDGAQIIQTNSYNNVAATFNMKINNPEDNVWSPEQKDGWQFIASPFVDTPISNFTGVDDNYDLYKYDGNKPLEWVNQKDDANSDANSFETEFVNGRAYLASYQTETTATFSGTLNNATSFPEPLSLSYIVGNDLANFHLLGNPFSFDMDWSKASKPNLVQGYAVINAAGNGYEYLTSGTIPVGDGFFVKTTAVGASFSYDHNVGGKRGEDANSINVIATSNAGSDNVIIRFAGEEEGFNKLQNFDEAIATVYVSENGTRYGIYNCEDNVQEIALNFDAKQMGNYTISLDINGKFENVTLVDRFTGIETNMLIEDEYSFTATSNDSHERFFIRLGNGQQPTADSQFVFQSGEELILSIEGTVQIVDMLGRVVYSNDHSNGNNRISVSEFNDATYVVRVVNEEGVKVQKVVIY